MKEQQVVFRAATLLNTFMRLEQERNDIIQLIDWRIRD